MLQAFLFPCIPDLCCGKCVADTEKITDQNYGKSSYCRMSGSGKNEDMELGRNGYD
jgi:hypothetical protein